jgi:hypothetical protein
MFRKKNVAAWRSIALLSVLSLGISFLAMLPTQAYAATHEIIQIFRPTTSTVGSVRVTNNTTKTPPACVTLPQQEVDIPVPGDYDGQNQMLIENFPDAGCGAPGFPNTANNFTGRAAQLPPCLLANTNRRIPACRLYTTPPNA